MNLQKKLNMKLNIITCPSAVKKMLDFPCGKGLGDWVVPNLCEFSFENSFIKKCALAHYLATPFGRGKDWKGWRSQFRSVAEEWRRFDAGTLESLVFGC